MLALNEGACQWVSQTLKRDLTDSEKELVTILCASLGTGPWNIHRSWSVLRPCGYGAKMSVYHNLATYDSDALTRLVFAAHDRCCRVSIVPCNPARLTIQVHPRKRDGDGLSDRHPTIADAEAKYRRTTRQTNVEVSYG